MILLYDTVQLRESHAPFTRAFTQMVAQACPGEQIIIHARRSHLDAAFGPQAPVLGSRLTQEVVPEILDGPPIPILQTLRFLGTTYRRHQQQRPLVIFLTAHPYHIWAAKLFRRRYTGFHCHLVLHGDIGSIRQPRSTNPLRRLTDYCGSMAHANHADIRFLVLETHIGVNVAATIPAAGNYIDIVRHPCEPRDVAWQAPCHPAGCLRFGLLGIAGPSKGLDVFARIALRVIPTPVTVAQFRMVGKIQHGCQDIDLSGISGPRPFSKDWLPQSLFEQELTDLHYAILPYNMDYYALAASGVLLDALRWRKPIIAFNTPVIQELTLRFGEIGHICTDEDDMLATVQGLLSNFNPDRYQAQRRNLDTAYRSRLPEALAVEYAQVLRSRWPGQPTGTDTP